MCAHAQRDRTRRYRFHISSLLLNITTLALIYACFPSFNWLPCARPALGAFLMSL